MIVPDVNTLVYAYRREAEQHEPYHAWLSEVLEGPEDVAFADHCLAGFLRIVTNPRIFDEPAPIAAAATFVDRLRRASRARSIASTPATWALLGRWIEADPAIRGNLVPDAYLAALTVSHGGRLATADRGFGRFERLVFFAPVTPR